MKNEKTITHIVKYISLYTVVFAGLAALPTQSYAMKKGFLQNTGKGEGVQASSTPIVKNPGTSTSQSPPKAKGKERGEEGPTATVEFTSNTSTHPTEWVVIDGPGKLKEYLKGVAVRNAENEKLSKYLGNEGFIEALEKSKDESLQYTDLEVMGAFTTNYDCPNLKIDYRIEQEELSKLMEISSHITHLQVKDCTLISNFDVLTDLPLESLELGILIKSEEELKNFVNYQLPVPILNVVVIYEDMQNEGLKQLVNAHPNIVVLDIGDCRKITDVGVVAQLECLTELDMCHAGITGKDLKNLPKSLQKLTLPGSFCRSIRGQNWIPNPAGNGSLVTLETVDRLCCPADLPNLQALRFGTGDWLKGELLRKCLNID